MDKRPVTIYVMEKFGDIVYAFAKSKARYEADGYTVVNELQESKRLPAGYEDAEQVEPEPEPVAEPEPEPVVADEPAPEPEPAPAKKKKSSKKGK